MGRLAVACAAAAWVAAAVAAAQSPAPPGDRFTAVATRALAAGERSESALEFVVTRWTTREEFDELRRVLGAEGQEAFVAAARAQPPAGAMHEFLRRPVVGRRLHALTLAISCTEVRCFENAGQTVEGRRVVIFVLTGAGGGASFVQLELDKDGRGDGSLVDDAVLRYNTETDMIHVFDATGARVRLSHVQESNRSK